MIKWIPVETPPGYRHDIKRVNPAFIVHIAETDMDCEPEEGVCYIRDSQGFVTLYRGTIKELLGEWTGWECLRCDLSLGLGPFVTHEYETIVKHCYSHGCSPETGAKRI